jgi:hypothetical protein
VVAAVVTEGRGDPAGPGDSQDAYGEVAQRRQGVRRVAGMYAAGVLAQGGVERGEFAQTSLSQPCLVQVIQSPKV